MVEKSKILVVDDNENFCQSVADNLEIEGYEVVTAKDGFEALDLIKKNGFMLVLMDVRMPVMNGLETFKKVKEISPDVQVIMVTAFAVEDLIKEALNEGAFGVLNKPLDFDELFTLIRQASQTNKPLLLIADDDENLCQSLKDGLETQDYLVRIALDGAEALQQSRKNNFDVILIDMQLPILNGLETYLAIRDIRPNMTAIIITGHRADYSEMVQQTIQQNAYTCLEKPINMDMLISLIGEIEEQKKKGTIIKPE